VLASYFPWLQSIAISLQAGFMEECLFRAIPIAGAVLLGRRFGHKTAWVVGAFILQAVIFGAGHANYPNQPSYARVVELILPSIGFGLIYYFFGLLPAIIMHFAYDVVWFALPLFVSTASGVWVDQLIVILLTLIPLWVVLISRLRTGKWVQLKGDDYNHNWQPPVKEEAPAIEEKPAPETRGLPVKFSNGLLIAGILGLLIWIFLSDFKNSAPPLNVDRSQAITIADRELQSRQIDLDQSWQSLSKVVKPLDQDDRFVWQEGSAADYQKLMGQYLSPPAWMVRYVRFTGDVAERAEEYRVYIDRNGDVRRFRHKLPEKRAGANLEADSTRRIAQSFIKEKYELDTANLKEVSATPSKLPNRTDWTFTYADTGHYPLDQGQARIDVKIAGSRVVDGYRYVHAPEDWQRNERNQQSLMSVFGSLRNIITLLLFLTGIVIAIIYWSRKQFSVRVFLAFLVLVLGLRLIDLFNGLPGSMAGFSTAEPYQNQLLTAIALPIIGFLFISAAVGLLNGFIRVWKGFSIPAKRSLLLISGVSTGAIMVGVSTIVSAFEPSFNPVWAKYTSLTNYLPFLEGVNSAWRFILLTTLYLFMFTALHRLTGYWQKRRALYSILFILVGIIVSGSTDTTIGYWLLSGVAISLVYWLLYVFVFRFELALIPLAFTIPVVLRSVRRVILSAHPAANSIAIVTIVFLALIAFYWFRTFLSNDNETRESKV
ncbi:MAG: CPBP family intramembrane metalloprotease, partial [Caldithrix sp.]|nr:CPBP family intramembrane metalloprotease [Caldithrix sp.]